MAIEPAPNNCDLLARNTQFRDVEVLQCGIGSSAGIAVLTDPGYGEWAYRTEASGDGITVPMTTLGCVLRERDCHQYVPFILKLDIEGSERGMFDDEHDIASLFPVIILEPHDWMLPNLGTSQSFVRFHANHSRDFLSRGENVFSIDYSILLKPPQRVDEMRQSY